MMCKKLLLTFVLTLGLVCSAWAQPGMPVSQDVGGPAIAGTVAYSPGTGFGGSDEWTIQGSGADIWGTWDQFQFVFRPLVGDGEASVRVASMTSVHDWAKVGVMIRETLDGDSKYVGMLLTGSNGVGTHWREETGGESSNAMIPNYVAPHWVKIVRTGNTISTWHSFAGDQFFLPAQTLEVPMNETVYIGMVVLSHDNGQLETAVFDAVDLQAAPVLGAWNISPADGATDVALDAVISWSPGDTATAHKVYFGDSTPPPEIGDQAETTYAPALAPSTTYYYQIDEVGGDAGEIMSFSTVSGAASGFSPADGAKVPAEGVIVRWTSGITADSSNVYFGTSDPPEFVGNGNVLSDVTGPGDVVLGVPNDGLMDGDDWGWPAGELPAFAIDDNTGTKFLHFRGDLMPTGIQVTPAVGSSVVTGITLTTANDSPGRDPIAYELSGSNVSIDGPYELIAAGDVVDFAQAGAYPRFTMNETEIVFDNDVAYEHYQLMFPMIRDAAGNNSMQIAEIELLSDKKPSTGYDPGPLEDGTTYYYQIDAVAGATVYPGAVISFSTYRPGTGTILREVWEGIGGVAVSDLTNNANYPANPSWSDEITTINVTDFADNFGSRIHGWLYPETSGDYTFWIASDDASQLWLSTSESPADAEMLCEEPGCCNDYDGTPVQKSAPVYLEGGQMYYISAMYKEGGGGDWCKVAWEGPDSPTRTDIDGYYLVPFVNLWPSAPSPRDGATVTELSTTLSWDAPEGGADSYDVYVNGELLGSTTETSIELDGLELGETYNPSTYNWQVDAIVGGEARSSAWSFSVTNNRLIDDFNAYDDIPLPEDPGTGSLIAAYDFEGTVNDISGNGNDGTLIGDAALVDGVLVLDGDGDCVDIGADPAFDPPGDFTISCWVNLNSWGGDWGNTIIGKRGESGVGWQLRRFGGDPRFSWTTRGMGSDDYPRSNLVPNFGQWYHLAATREGTEKRLYIDGVLDSTQGINENPVNTCEHTVYIGARANGDNSGPEAFFDGNIDDMRVYSTALSHAEVVHLAGAVAENPLTNTWSESGFVNASGGDGTMEVETFALPGMPYYLGEVSRTLPINLTEGGAKALSMWFRGDEGNVAEFMYASVANGGQSAIVLYDGDADDLANSDWQEWNIDMRDFGGVEDVAEQISIGILGLDGSASGDVMNFDDIRVYTGRCLPGMLKPEADITNDCRVNMADAEALVHFWNYPHDIVGDPGVYYEYFETWIFGNDIQNAPFDTTTPTRTGTVNNFDISIRDIDDWFGFRFIGSISVPTDGDYTFYTSSDDGSMLYIGDTTVVDNRGWHGMQWREGTIELTAGDHPITVTMFEEGGGEGLQVEYAGPGIDRQPIPDDVLSVGPMPSHVDLVENGAVDWADFFMVLEGWLDEQLWPY